MPGPFANAASTTPTTAVRDANDPLNIALAGVDQSMRDRIVFVYGEGTFMTIHTWWVLFYDPSVPSHGRAVQVDDGQITRIYEAMGGVVYPDSLTFARAQLNGAGSRAAMAAAQNYAAQHALAYDNVCVLLSMPTMNQALRWQVELLNERASKGFVFVNASDGTFTMYAPPGSIEGSFVSTGLALGQDIPFGYYTIPAYTLSPNHRYGVTVPQWEHSDEIDNPRNKVVEVKTGRVLAVIHTETGWDHSGHYVSVLPSRWSPDGSLLLWHVDGKWSPTALVLLKIEDGTVKWQIDLLKTAQQAILTRTRKAKPHEYLAAMKANAGNGSAYPDGFTVDVFCAGGESGDSCSLPVSLPLKVHADLTSDPKGIGFEYITKLDAHLDAVVDKNGKFTVTEFHLVPIRLP